MKPPGMVKFRLYIAADARNSTSALANLTAFCMEYLPGRHEIEVIDVTRNKSRALDDGILMTPTLIKFSPLPLRRIVGSLSQEQVLLNALGLTSPVA
jgi:circadian clock protein KaiB